MVCFSIVQVGYNKATHTHTYTHTHTHTSHTLTRTAPFEWVMAWRDMIPAHHYATILEQHFFPKWLQVCMM